MIGNKALAITAGDLRLSSFSKHSQRTVAPQGALGWSLAVPLTALELSGVMRVVAEQPGAESLTSWPCVPGETV